MILKRTSGCRTGVLPRLPSLGSNPTGGTMWNEFFVDYLTSWVFPGGVPPTAKTEISSSCLLTLSRS